MEMALITRQDLRNLIKNPRKDSKVVSFAKKNPRLVVISWDSWPKSECGEIWRAETRGLRMESGILESGGGALQFFYGFILPFSRVLQLLPSWAMYFIQVSNTSA